MAESPWAGRWYGVAAVAGVVAGLCAVVVVLVATVPLHVTAGDFDDGCGRAFSLDREHAEDPLCIDAADDRKAWIFGGGAAVVVPGLVAVGAVVAVAVVDPERPDLTDAGSLRSTSPSFSPLATSSRARPRARDRRGLRNR